MESEENINTVPAQNEHEIQLIYEIIGMLDINVNKDGNTISFNVNVDINNVAHAIRKYNQENPNAPLIEELRQDGDRRFLNV